MSGILTKDLYWLAGIWEGEGCFTFHTKVSNYVRIVLDTTDRDVAIRVSNIMHHEYQLVAQNTINAKKQVYRVSINGNRAIGWMMTLYCLMGIRRKAKIKELVTTWYNSPVHRTQCKWKSRRNS